MVEVPWAMGFTCDVGLLVSLREGVSGNCAPPKVVKVQIYTPEALFAALLALFLLSETFLHG